MRRATDEHVINQWIVAATFDPSGRAATRWAAEIVRRGLQDAAAVYVAQYQREEQIRQGKGRR